MQCFKQIIKYFQSKFVFKLGVAKNKASLCNNTSFVACKSKSWISLTQVIATGTIFYLTHACMAFSC